MNYGETGMKCLSIVGARPQFVKLAPVSRVLRRFCEERILHTGQHYDYVMSAHFFEELAIPDPDYHLEVGSGSHGAQTARMLEGIEHILQEERPDWVILYGDTNSTLAGALAAAKLGLAIAHIEAGLRSFNRDMPEEVNRIVADHVSDLLFCPTEAARQHALAEGLNGIEVVGDVMYDLLLQARPTVAERAPALLESLEIAPGEYFLATVHRPVNADDPQAMREIAAALNELPLPVIFPVHPRTRRRLQEYGVSWSERVRLIDPVGYLSMLALEQHAVRVLTDSGGVQKEAFLLGVPCVTLREETEWVETVEARWNVLVGSRREAILAAVSLPRPPVPTHNPYGFGDAAERITRTLLGAGPGRQVLQ